MKRSLLKSKITSVTATTSATTATTSATTATTSATTATTMADKSDGSDIIKINKKIQNATEGLRFECFNLLHDRVLPANKENSLIICDYVSSLRSEVNPSDGYRRNNIILLCKISIFFRNAKLFKEITREDVLSFLDSFRKIETVDPLHKWIGTYNLYRIELMRFFKWLNSPDIDYNKRPQTYGLQKTIHYF